MEIRFVIDDLLIEEIEARTHMHRATDIGQDAVRLLHWATKEAFEGRQITTRDDNGTYTPPVILGAIQDARANGIREKGGGND
jgi:hypothetical protein